MDSGIPRPSADCRARSSTACKEYAMRFARCFATLAPALLLAASTGVNAGDGMTVTINNNTTSNLLVNVYDLNTSPPTQVMSGESINSFATVSVSLAADGSGRDICAGRRRPSATTCAAAATRTSRISATATPCMSTPTRIAAASNGSFPSGICSAFASLLRIANPGWLAG
jgi:hypothetical protein